MCKKRWRLLKLLFKSFTLAAGAGSVAWGILAWASVKIPEKRQELLDSLTNRFVMAASIGMIAWTVLAWAAVQISKHIGGDCYDD